jgi:hypothetical protein
MNFGSNHTDRMKQDLEFFSSKKKIDINTNNLAGVNIMARNAMDSNNTHLAEQAKKCVENQECMRLLYHNMYNSDHKRDIRTTMKGGVDINDNVQPLTTPKPIFNPSLITQNQDILSSDDFIKSSNQIH